MVVSEVVDKVRKVSEHILTVKRTHQKVELKKKQKTTTLVLY